MLVPGLLLLLATVQSSSYSFGNMKPSMLLLLTIFTTIQSNRHLALSEPPLPPLATAATADQLPDNETVYRISKQLCWHCMGEAVQFLYGHNLVRARKRELPLMWDSQLANYARWWAGERQADCELMHSFPEGDFKLGENIYWGSGTTWTPMDAVSAWADEEKYYTYSSNSCAYGQQCGHYTQIVWKTTQKIGCARVVCDSGDVFMTCNYYPPGNYIGERPY